MKKTRPGKTLHFLIIGLLIAPFLLLPIQTPIFAQSATAWSTPVNLSAKMANAWFPDIAVDGDGGVKVIFLGSDTSDMKDSPLWGKYDKVYYEPISSSGVPEEAGPYNVAVSPFGVVPRASIAVDNSRGLVHMLFRSKGSLYYQNAPINKATSPAAWSEPRNIDDFGVSYYSDMVIDQHGTIHIVWTQVKGDDLDTLHQVIMYRQSTDVGKSWSFPKAIVTPKYGTTRAVLKLGQNDELNLSWDDGYDNQTARFTAALGGYTNSLDGGKTWNPPINFGNEKAAIAQTVSTTFGSDGVMLVWRILATQQVGFMVSKDKGKSWSDPALIPNITARGFAAQHFFDRYSLASDGNGRVHLAAVGLTESGKKGVEEKAEDLAIYHLVWENDQWSTPELVGQAPGFAEYPRLVVGPDRLHIVWFTRDKPVNDEFKNIWYSSRPYDTGVKVQPIGAYTPPTPTPASVSQVISTPKPLTILPPIESSPPRNWLEDGYMIALLSIVPVIILGVGGYGLLKWQLRRRKRG